MTLESYVQVSSIVVFEKKWVPVCMLRVFAKDLHSISDFDSISEKKPHGKISFHNVLNSSVSLVFLIGHKL